MRLVGDFNDRFLEAHGFGKDEALSISQYDKWAVRGGFLKPYDKVGREPPTNDSCGKHCFYGRCAETALHGSVGGEDFYHNNVRNCHLYKCSLCWKYGWCVDRANSGVSRLLTAVNLLHLPLEGIEHFSVSVPKRLYNLSPQDMVNQAVLALNRSGIFDCVTILHPFRKDLKRRDLFLSFHYHVMGWLRDGSYDRCRECSHAKTLHCWDCDGFEGVTRRAHKDDGWIVSLAKNEKGVVEKRKSIFGTLWYQCEHSGFKVGVPHFQIVRWWGRLAKRKFKTVPMRKMQRCAICNSVLKPSFLPVGTRAIVANRGERGFLKNFTLPHVDDDLGR